MATFNQLVIKERNDAKRRNIDTVRSLQDAIAAEAAKRGEKAPPICGKRHA